MRIARARARLGAIALAVGALLFATGVADGATSGSAPAVHLYRSAAATMNGLAGYVINQHGYVRIDDSIGRHRLTLWAWGSEQFQPGEEATNERIELSQRSGRVTWILDTLRPAKTCAQGGPCPSILPLQFFITAKAAFVGIVSSGSMAACFTKEPLGDMPYPAGSEWWFALGRFSAPRAAGVDTYLQAQYVLDAQRWTEREWVRTSTHRFVHSTFSVARSAHHRAFAFAATYTFLGARPKTPTINLCKSP